MKRIGKLFSLAAAALVLHGCFAPSSQEAEYVLLSTAGGNELTQKSGSMFLSVSSNASWTLALIFEGEESDWATVTPAEGTGDKSSVILKWEANTTDSTRTVRILPSTKLKSGDELTFSQPGISGGSSGGSSGGTTTKAGWLELPETKANDGLDVFTHTMTVGSQTMRNYTFYWDYDALVAHWVAYPLNRGLIGSGSRSDEWALDPLISSSKHQPVLYRAYSEKDTYARGHQLPSADRLSYNANVQTFYGTNMTPQRHTFNEGVWANLEAAVRNWSYSCDTLYVVTGCDLNGSTEYAHDNEGKEILIPTGYWKAVLRYSSAGTVGYNGFLACAVYLPHNYSGSKTISSSMAMTIDALEEKLGIDLFVNLPAKVGAETAAKIESQDPKSVSVWW